jgi:hypothetical protein
MFMFFVFALASAKNENKRRKGTALPKATDATA